ncbi:PfkB family carbohydrate kinase [Stappia sp.]|uniref:PfkB family carbohydrate kinase n=1 Tax=Stappia sp. TaxID=1870903 RepID=UPI003D0BA291
MPVAAFGAIHLDTIAHAGVPILRETSTPARLSASPGGVAANVARALARLGVATALAGNVGTDAEGDALLTRLVLEGIDVSAVRRSALPTGRYLALHDPDGSLAAAVVDGRITDALAPGSFLPPAPTVERADLWFLDANLPTSVIASLASAAGPRRIAADAVSQAKAARLTPVLFRLDMLFCNAAEAAAILGRDKSYTDRTGPDETNAEGLARALHGNGARAVILSQGAEPVVLATDGKVVRIPTRKTPVVDVTGAGDALIAGTLAGLEFGLPLAAAVNAGVNAAALTLSQAGAVADALSWPAIAPAPQ